MHGMHAQKVGLAICKQGGEQAEAAVRSHARNTRLPHPTALAPPADSGSASAGLLGSLWGSVGANGGVGGGGRLTVGYVTSHFTSSSIGREMLFLLGSHLATVSSAVPSPCAPLCVLSSMSCPHLFASCACWRDSVV